MAAALIMAPSLAFAAPVTWYIHNAEMLALSDSTPSGTLEGSFKYDVDTGDYSDVNIVRKDTAGAIVETFTVVGNLAPQAPTSGKVAAIPTGATASFTYSGPGVILMFTTGMATASGSTNINGGGTRIGQCLSQSLNFCNGMDAASYLAAGAYVSTSSTPTPAVAAVPTLTEWAMIMLGLTLAGGAVLTLQRRRQMA